MSVKKVVFRGLRTNKTYLSLGGVRFIEQGEVIPLINPSNESATNVTYPNATIHASHAFAYQGGWISNAFTSTKPQVGYTLNGQLDTKNNYWLSTNPSVENTITVNFTRERIITEIEFVPNPQLTIDRDAGTLFFIDIYDSSNNIIKTEEVNTITQRDTVQKITVSSDSSYLFEVNGSIKYLTSSLIWESITSPLSTQTFATHGMKLITSDIQLSFEQEFGKQYRILAWSDKSVVTKATQSAFPHPQLILPVGDISLIGVDSIDSISITSIGDVKVAISFDSGVTWLSYSDNNWISIDNAHNGISPHALSTLTSEQISIAKGNSDKIRIQYSLSGDASLDKLMLKVNMTGTERVLPSSDYEMTYDVLTKTISYDIKRNMTVSCNYLDV